MGAASAEPDDLGNSPAAAPGTGTPGGGPGADRGESTFTVLVAAGANLGIAIA
ncbi:cation transporter, partial [Streptomyces sp. PGLac3x]